MIVFQNTKNNCKLELSHTATYDEGRYHTVIVEVVCGAFSAKYPFCIFRDDFENFILFSKNMWHMESVQAFINDADTTSHLCFSNLKHGHIQLSGEIGIPGMSFLQFSFQIDQTCYTNIVEFWEAFFC